MSFVVLKELHPNSSIAEAGGSDGGNAGEIAPIPSFFLVKKYQIKPV